MTEIISNNQEIASIPQETRQEAMPIEKSLEPQVSTDTVVQEDDTEDEMEKQPRVSARTKSKTVRYKPPTPLPKEKKMSPAKRRRSPSPDPNRPRWYNGAYVVLMALREAREALPRQELLRRALELDEKISKEKGLPRCFDEENGEEYCSAVLRDNKEGYFHVYHPPGSRSLIYSLAYEPSSFENAHLKYEEWNRRLIKYDWPIMFGSGEAWYDEIPEKSESTPQDSEATVKAPSQPPMDRDEEELQVLAEALPPVKDDSDDEDFAEEASERNVIQGGDSTPQRNRATGDPFSPVHIMDRIYVYRPDGVSTCFKRRRFGRPKKEEVEASVTPEIPTERKVSDEPEEKVEKTLDIPTSWRDILRIDTSSIPNAGRGVFALRVLPKYTILGFYFGVPMTEDEFDERKDKVGVASQYSIRYRNTVLDATDENGIPFTEDICPFPYINEDPENSNVAFVDGHIVNQILVMTTREIQTGEELFVDYGTEMDRTFWGKIKSTDVVEEERGEKAMDDARASALNHMKDATKGVDFKVDGERD